MTSMHASTPASSPRVKVGFTVRHKSAVCHGSRPYDYKPRVITDTHNCPRTHSLTHPPTHSPTLTLTHLLAHPLIHSLTLTLTLSLTPCHRSDLASTYSQIRTIQTQHPGLDSSMFSRTPASPRPRRWYDCIMDLCPARSAENLKEITQLFDYSSSAPLCVRLNSLVPMIAPLVVAWLSCASSSPNCLHTG